MNTLNLDSSSNSSLTSDEKPENFLMTSSLGSLDFKRSPIFARRCTPTNSLSIFN